MKHGADCDCQICDEGKRIVESIADSMIEVVNLSVEDGKTQHKAEFAKLSELAGKLPEQMKNGMFIHSGFRMLMLDICSELLNLKESGVI